MLLSKLPAQGQALHIGDESPGLLEAGVPAVMVRGQYSLGLDSAPTDLRLMPDGRMLVLAGRQIAMGDGVRWDVWREASSDMTMIGAAAGVADDGAVYIGTQGGFAQVIFGDSGEWRGRPVAGWPRSNRADNIVPRFLVQSGGGWFWHTGSGVLIAWKPGEPARIVGRADTTESVFVFKGSAYMSDRTSGTLYRLGGDGSMVAVPMAADVTPNFTVTCATPWGPDAMLVGTYARGLLVFDGRVVKPLAVKSPLSGRVRINDVCAVEGGYYAAAVEGLGIVFFDRTGRVVEVLDHATDSRFSHVRKLVPGPGGVVWGLLSEGIMRVEFPSRVSNFEPLIGSGLSTVHPYRLDGRLWLMIDGRIEHADYDTFGRLTGFTSDTPPDRFAYTLSLVGNHLLTGTERGAYVRKREGWTCVAPDSVNLRIVAADPLRERWLYTAGGEIGWLSEQQGVFKSDVIQHVPGLTNVYNTLEVPDGTYWMELGNAKLGRIRMIDGAPRVDLYGAKNGLPGGWAQVFSIDGKVYFNVADRIFRFDETRSRFVEDPSFAAHHGGLGNIVGRPALDARGRLWMTADGAVHILHRTSRGWRDSREHVSVGFLPYFFTFQPDGVVWMHSEHRFARYDPRLPEGAEPPLRALVTVVDLPGSGRTIRLGRGAFPLLDYADNSLVVHFVALGSSRAPVGFEVRLEGGGSGWVASGSSGTAVFNHLKEGSYVLRVRPRAGEVEGVEARLPFSIRPPWFRSTYAYVVYGLFALGAVFGTAWIASYLERREKARLGLLVARRTAELAESNERLAAQIGEVRRLLQAIEQSPVGVLLAAPDGTITYANPCYRATHGHSGGAPVGESLAELRWAGLPPNTREGMEAVLARAESWHGQLTQVGHDGRMLHLRTTVSPIRGAGNAVHGLLLLEEDISGWMNDQERRRRLEAQLFQAQKLESLGTLAGGIAHDFNNILTGILGFAELASYAPGISREVRQALNQIRTGGLRAKDLVAQILTFSRKSFAKLEPVDLGAVVGDALKLLRASTPPAIEIATDLQPGLILGNTTQIHQVVLNLATNAVHAIGRQGRLEVSVRRILVDEALAAELHDPPRGPCMCLRVADTGHGMTPETISRIFDPFFTTKKPGEGTGLGLAIVRGIVTSLGGSLSVKSREENGTTFDLYFPECQGPDAVSAEPGAAPVGSGQDILVVDDEPSIGMMVAMRLVQLNYRPTVFQDPVLALESFRAEPQRYHALVTDLTMAQMSGVELVHELRRGRPSLPVVVMTGFSKDSAREQLANLPLCTVLQKPFACDDLARVLGRLLEEAST